MRGGAGIQFRPTIVLCVGAEGRAVGDWLTSLLPSLDAPLREGVALLGVDRAAEDEPLAGVWLDDSAPDASADLNDETSDDESASEPVSPVVTLPTSIIQALRGRRAPDQGALLRRGVLDDAVISRIKDAGYGIPRGSVAVWIAAAADSPELAEVIAAAQSALRSEHVEGWTLLALTNTYPLDPEDHQRQVERCAAQPWEALLVDSVAGAPPVTFAYIFETHDERGLFWEGPDETSFAAAEAIFTLTATGLIVTREYEETLRRSLPRMVRAPQERMSSVATSRLTFPRAQAERYCAYQLGAAILREWTPEQAAQLSREEERAQTADARADLRRILDETATSNTLVAALRRAAQKRSRRRAHESELPPDRSDSKLVLRWLSRATVEPLLTPRLDLPAALLGQRQRAEEGFAAWEEALVPAWSRYADQAAQDIASHANALTLEGALGVERAYTYVATFDDALREEQDTLDTQRARRAARRAQFLSELEALREGPWLAALADDGAGSAETSTTSENSQTSETSDEKLEARVAARLGARWRWLTARRPHPVTLGAATTLAASTLALLALLLAPPSWLRAVPVWLALLFAPFALCGLAAWGYARYHRKLEDDAASDLYQHYRAIYRYRIGKRESEWRETVFAMLRARMGRILDRLTHWERFIGEMADALASDAAAEEARLFDGALGRRDVLVANRRRLRRDGYALRDFEQDVSKRRQAQPLPDAPWHASARELLARLRDALHGHVSLVEAPSSAIAGPVRDYCAGIVRPYLTGELVNLTEALESIAASDEASVLDALLERATLLYHPADQPRAATSFVAAREADLVTLTRGKQLGGLITLSMREREWLGVARLLPGGARPDFLRDRDEASHAPIAVAPDWTTRATGDHNGAAIENGGLLS
ncbi:MAG TPA: hypothetical protein VF812_05480 [Ktedonobacterales bacterium]